MVKLKKLLWPFKRQRQERDFNFISILERTHYTQSNYVVRATSEKQARQSFKLFLHAARKSDIPYYHPSVTVTEYHYHNTSAYCIKSDFLPESHGDHLMQQYYQHLIYSSRPAKGVSWTTGIKNFINSLLFTLLKKRYDKVYFRVERGGNL